MSDLPGTSDDGRELYSDDVSRAYRLAAREEPSPELDAAVRTAALRAAGSQSRSFTRAPLLRWGVPLAVAATIAVGVSVAFLAVDQPDSPLAPVSEAPVPPMRESKQSAPGAAEATTGDNSARDAPQSASGLSDGQAPVTAATREARPSRERTTRDQVVSKREQAPAPTASPESPNPPERATEPSADSIGAAPAAAPALPDTPKGMQKVAPGSSTQIDQDAELLSPEVWLQRIRELRDKGELRTAEESLRAFRRRYPDYPLPADLSVPTQTGR
jgi:hypothetical protein